jgi:hypothetical protein
MILTSSSRTLYPAPNAFGSPVQRADRHAHMKLDTHSSVSSSDALVRQLLILWMNDGSVVSIADPPKHVDCQLLDRLQVSSSCDLFAFCSLCQSSTRLTSWAPPEPQSFHLISHHHDSLKTAVLNRITCEQVQFTCPSRPLRPSSCLTLRLSFDRAASSSFVSFWLTPIFTHSAVGIKRITRARTLGKCCTRPHSSSSASCSSFNHILCLLKSESETFHFTSHFLFVVISFRC